MKESRAEFYLPSVAEFPDDLRRRNDLLDIVREHGYKNGLMLVLRPEDLYDINKQNRQLNNLEPYVKKNESERPRVFGMHPNMPIVGKERLNLFDNPHYSVEYLSRGIDLIAKLPDELTPDSGRTLSFHNNCLVVPKDVPSIDEEEYWSRAFEGVLAHITQLSTYAKEKGVNLNLETTPIPEFGDVENRGKYLDDGHTFWSQLGNPWPVLFWRDEIRQVREAGVGMAIDICHSFIALRTVQELKKIKDKSLRDKIRQAHMISREDLERVADLSSDEFSDYVLKNTKPGDVWHVSDVGLGLVENAKNDQNKIVEYEEGVALFEGDMPVKVLQKIIDSGLNQDIKFVLETNESDFIESPNTTRSMKKIFPKK